jgi:hypothetical protein
MSGMESQIRDASVYRLMHRPMRPTCINAGVRVNEGAKRHFNPAKDRGLRLKQYFNTLMDSCGGPVMSHSLSDWGITALGKSIYSFWVGEGLPQWGRRFTHENDGGATVLPIRCWDTVELSAERAFRNFLGEKNGKAND